MLGRDAFRQFLRSWIDVELSAARFKRKGATFVRHCDDEVTQLIDYRISRRDPPKATDIHFTVGLGILSHRLCKFYGQERQPIVWDNCHWRIRLGFLLPEKRDVWWTMTEGQLESLGHEHQAHLRSVVLPELSRRTRDEQLLDEWLTGDAPGLTEEQRLLNVLVLGRSIRRDDDWRPTARQLLIKVKDRPAQYLMEEYLSELWPHFQDEVAG